MEIDHRVKMCLATYSQHWHDIEIRQLIDFYMMKALNNNKFIKIQEKLNMMKIKSKNCVKNIYLRWSFYAIIVSVLAVNFILKKTSIVDNYS